MRRTSTCRTRTQGILLSLCPRWVWGVIMLLGVRSMNTSWAKSRKDQFGGARKIPVMHMGAGVRSLFGVILLTLGPVASKHNPYLLLLIVPDRRSVSIPQFPWQYQQQEWSVRIQGVARPLQTWQSQKNAHILKPPLVMESACAPAVWKRSDAYVEGWPTADGTLNLRSRSLLRLSQAE